jgi:hypothetical protein
MIAKSIVTGIALLGFVLAAVSLFAGLYFMVAVLFRGSKEKGEKA